MKFCSECFCDTEIKPIIESIGAIGNCSVCGSNNVYLYDTDFNAELTELFEDLINIYTPVSLLPECYPKSEIALLKDELINRWNIFNNLSAGKVYSILTAICAEKYDEKPELFDNPVGISELYDREYILSHSLLKGNSWNEFTENLKTVNRFHTNYINLDILEKFCSYIRKSYEKGTIFYRGRISPEEGYSCDQMDAPPNCYATAGRANCDGIRCLYLAGDIKTTIHEVRSRAFDFVTIGRFELLQNIIVVNLKGIDKISPFVVDLDILELAINKEHLNKINQEMGKALRRNDSSLDYIPTQYISDFIKSLKIDEDYGGKYIGIEYNSTMNKKGYNLAIYYPEYFKCINTELYSITNLKYDTLPEL